MKPYYEDESCTIYHGDCRGMVEAIEADVLVSDPPYGIAWKPLSASFGLGAQGTSITGDESVEVRDEVLLKWGDERPWIVFGSLRASAPARWKQALVFHKPKVGTGRMGNQRPWLNNWEPIWVGGSWPKSVPSVDAVIGTHEFAASGYSGYATRAGHSHAKPLDVMVQLLANCPPGTILDPFMGSGTTLRAAKDSGRKAIGIEIEERYCALAAERLGQEVLDLGMAA